MPQEQLPTNDAGSENDITTNFSMRSTSGAGVWLATATEAIRGPRGAPTPAPPPSNFTHVLWYIGQLVTIFTYVQTPKPNKGKTLSGYELSCSWPLSAFACPSLPPRDLAPSPVAPTSILSPTLPVSCCLRDSALSGRSVPANSPSLRSPRHSSEGEQQAPSGMASGRHQLTSSRQHRSSQQGSMWFFSAPPEIFHGSVRSWRCIDRSVYC
jgi:hypothetical protein